jgi:hypothetical protein
MSTGCELLFLQRVIPTDAKKRVIPAKAGTQFVKR